MHSRIARLALVALPLSAAACTASSEPDDTVPVHTAAPRTLAAGRVRTLSQPQGPANYGDPLPDAAPASLAISLRRQHEDDLAALLTAQQDPASPLFHAWLTPAEYGDRFGLSETDYARVVAWAKDAGFNVTTYPNRLFLEAHGTVAQVRDLLGVQIRTASNRGRSFRSVMEDLSVPEDIAPHLLKVGGLDTRLRLRHRMNVTWYGQETQVLDADDLRTLYDIPKTDQGASGLTLAVLATQEGTQPNQNDTPGPPLVLPDMTAIDDYLNELSHATATYNPIILTNNDDDFDVAGSNSEYQLDVEMQSVGAPNAKDLDLVLSPASVVFQVGAQYIANTLSAAVSVSTSIGLCESEEVDYDGGAATNPTSDAYLLRQAVQQGLAEGQTWFAASGDMGADDCNDDTSGTGNGFMGGNATVDFPCSAPEIVCVGGTMFNGAGSWSPDGGLEGYPGEVVCNEGANGVAGGGGQSLLFAKPTYQQGVGPNKTDGTRDVPDISLIAASSTPGVVDFDCGEGQDACPDAGTGIPLLDITGGTSVASPLAAGIFAHLVGDLGCRLGDVHPTLYMLGAAQLANPGPASPFHDITKGNNNWKDPAGKEIVGFEALPGFDLASGWGSLDVAKLVAAWPACSKTDGGLVSRDAGMKSDAADAGERRDTGVVTTTPDASSDAHALVDAGHGAPDAGLVGSGDAGRAADATGAAHRDAAVTDDAGGEEGGNGSGCSCRAARSERGGDDASGWMGTLLGLGAVLARRRRS